ncbi:MAG: hypothetical protein ACSHYA_03775 [Opitutaceae bacterium]
MPEKATLLTSIPPAAKSDPVKQTTLLTPIEPKQIEPRAEATLTVESKSEETLSILPTGIEPRTREPATLLQPLQESNKPKSILSEVKGIEEGSGAQVKNLNASPRPTLGEDRSDVASKPQEVAAVEMVPSDVQSSDSAAGDGSQMVTIISVALVLGLVGVAALVFLRKSKGGGSEAPKGKATSWEDRKKAQAAKTSVEETAPVAKAPQSDPIIDFLNQEAASGGAASASAKPLEQTSVATPPPPPKVKKPLPKRGVAPKKPGGSIPAPNAPSQIKAPSKPKKRF